MTPDHHLDTAERCAAVKQTMGGKDRNARSHRPVNVPLAVRTVCSQRAVDRCGALGISISGGFVGLKKFRPGLCPDPRGKEVMI
jgi:hypothetical protein